MKLPVLSPRCKEQMKKLAPFAMLLLGAAAVFWVCTFKIMDRDFWWHITAGKIVLQTRHMITVDPFAYTRAGLPYLATHEWLAQIILFLIYHAFGAAGIIVFRGVVACAAVGLLLLLSKKLRLWHVLLALLLVVLVKGSFLERPQLFTFIFFSSFVLLAFRFLDAESERMRLRMCAAFIGLEFLWVNMHGGAALVGCAIVCFVLVQSFSDAVIRTYGTDALRAARLLVIVLALMGVTLVLPPNGFGTITYLSQLLQDKTIMFIAEWHPRPWLPYLADVWPFLILSLAALYAGRRHVVFNGLLLVATFALSRLAFRHEILFLLASLATCIYQADRSAWCDRLSLRIATRPFVVAVVTVVYLVWFGHAAYERSYAFERQDNLFGFGQFDLARGAVDFIEREHLSGNMFNTYGIGGYLIYRGYPDRKVFIDGRNVDYGFDFMAHAYAAGIEAERWNELARTYDLSYAVIDYDAIKSKGTLPYSAILDVSTEWALVYLDDWVAVYLRKTPQNQALIQRLQYKKITATSLQFHDFSDASASDMPGILSELQRVQAESPASVKATVALAKIALSQDRHDDVAALAARAMRIRPDNPEPLAVLAGSYVKRSQWEQAAQAYEKVLSLAGDNYPDINRAFIAAVFQKAGHTWRAWYLRFRSGLPSPSEQRSASGSVVSSDEGGMVNPAQDALDFQNQGYAYVEAGEFEKAEESFRLSLKINPGSAESWNNLCALSLTIKKDAEAIDMCKRAVDIDPSYGDAHYNLALAYYRTKAWSDAEQEAKKAKAKGRAKESEELLLLIRKMKLQ